jgi:hypothetical protein
VFGGPAGATRPEREAGESEAKESFHVTTFDEHVLGAQERWDEVLKPDPERTFYRANEACP